ncbi:MAG: hypothetical protein AB2693_26985 [Candidatus Thiodiazotropha sp.]
MAEQQLHNLTQVLNENNQILMQNSQTVDLNSRAVAESANKIAASLEDYSFGDLSGPKSNEGKIPFVIKAFDGNPKEFDTWIKQIEKHAFLFNCDDRKKQLVAYQTCTGLVSDYIKRYLDSSGDKTWTNLKDNLQSRFSPVLDRPKAFEQLVTIRQKRDEDVQFYAERLLSLAEKAYPDRSDSINPIVEQQLLTIFLCGLSDSNIRAQVERVQPASFEEAFQIALREQGIMYRCATRNKVRPDRLDKPPQQYNFNANRRDEQPMDIDHTRRNNYKFCTICNKRGHDKHSHKGARTVRQGEIECWGCKGKGHTLRNCESKN